MQQDPRRVPIGGFRQPLIIDGHLSQKLNRNQRQLKFSSNLILLLSFGCNFADSDSDSVSDSYSLHI